MVSPGKLGCGKIIILYLFFSCVSYFAGLSPSC